MSCHETHSRALKSSLQVTKCGATGEWATHLHVRILS
jgi:hypothetical protein